MSVRLSQDSIVSKPLKLFLNVLDHLVYSRIILVFSDSVRRNPIQLEPRQGDATHTRCGRISWFSTKITVYLVNGTVKFAKVSVYLHNLYALCAACHGGTWACSTERASRPTSRSKKNWTRSQDRRPKATDTLCNTFSRFYASRGGMSSRSRQSEVRNLFMYSDQ